MAELGSTIFHSFVKQVLVGADEIAISTPTAKVSYQQLLHKVEQFSASLAEQCHNQLEAVAILLEPSVEFVVAMLACLKLGLPYIPLNTNYPPIHIEHILLDARVSFLITDCPVNLKLKNLKLISPHSANSGLSSAENASVSAVDVAYIIYTSGSTGSPKGVCVRHQGVIELLASTQAIFAINQQDKIPLFHSLAFDFSVWEIFSALLNGATLLIPQQAQKQSLFDYCHFLKKSNASILNITPAMFYLLIDELALQSREFLSELSLRAVILGGDVLRPIRLAAWFDFALAEQVKVYNMYGITEGTIHATCVQINKAMTSSTVSPIGKALAHMDITVLDVDGAPIEKLGEVGEMCLSGPAVAKSYLYQPQLTTEKFFYNDQGEWSFKTGDLIRRFEDGFEYVGRKDRQLSVRAYRIDPLEIESALLLMSQIKSAWATVHADELIAVVSLHQGKLDKRGLRHALKQKLPAYMIPSKFFVLNYFPLNANGKLDTKKILENMAEKNPMRLEKQADQTLEQQLVALWKDILNVAEVSKTENFFDAGGDSLLLMKLHFNLQKNFGTFITLVDVVSHPTIQQFAKFLSSANALVS